MEPSENTPVPWVEARTVAGEKIVNSALQAAAATAPTWACSIASSRKQRLDFEGISATRGGAVDAVVLVDAGGRRSRSSEACAGELLEKGV